MLSLVHIYQMYNLYSTTLSACNVLIPCFCVLNMMVLCIKCDHSLYGWVYGDIKMRENDRHGRNALLRMYTSLCTSCGSFAGSMALSHHPMLDLWQTRLCQIYGTVTPSFARSMALLCHPLPDLWHRYAILCRIYGTATPSFAKPMAVTLSFARSMAQPHHPLLGLWQSHHPLPDLWHYYAILCRIYGTVTPSYARPMADPPLPDLWHCYAILCRIYGTVTPSYARPMADPPFARSMALLCHPLPDLWHCHTILC